MSNNIKDTLSERGARYGKFDDHASITQALKLVMYGSVLVVDPCTGSVLATVAPRYDRANPKLSSSQWEALEMIVHKIGRILNGDPNYDDSWIDIAGYAQLIVDEIREKVNSIEDSRVNNLACPEEFKTYEDYNAFIEYCGGMVPATSHQYNLLLTSYRSNNLAMGQESPSCNYSEYDTSLLGNWTFIAWMAGKGHRANKAAMQLHSYQDWNKLCTEFNSITGELMEAML